MVTESTNKWINVEFYFEKTVISFTRGWFLMEIPLVPIRKAGSDFIRLPGVEIEAKCNPWDFLPILNVIVTQLSPGDSHLLLLSHPVITGDNWVTMTFKMSEKSHGYHLVSISTSEFLSADYRSTLLLPETRC